MANLMRKIKITLCLLFLLSSFQLKAQESVPFSLKMFLNDYGNFMDGFLDLNDANINYINSSGTNYFMNVEDLRLWPDNFDLQDNYFTTLSPTLFENLSQLERLDLSGNQLITLPLVNEKCWIEGREEIEKRRKDKEEHWNKWKYVGATLESLPPCPSNYCHLPAFTETFLGGEGGVDWVRGLEELEELEALNGF